MYGDEIECLACGKKFKDTTNRTDKKSDAGKEYQWQGQDSRYGDFKNMCPHYLSTNTKNLAKPTKEGKKRYKKNSKRGRCRQKALNKSIDIVNSGMKYHKCKKCKKFHNFEQCSACKCKEYILVHCWYCGTTGINLLDKYGCCKKCDTNLVKYPTRDKHEYPEELRSNKDSNRKLDDEVLGYRENFTVPRR